MPNELIKNFVFGNCVSVTVTAFNVDTIIDNENRFRNFISNIFLSMKRKVLIGG